MPPQLRGRLQNLATGSRDRRRWWLRRPSCRWCWWQAAAGGELFFRRERGAHGGVIGKGATGGGVTLIFWDTAAAWRSVFCAWRSAPDFCIDAGLVWAATAVGNCANCGLVGWPLSWFDSDRPTPARVLLGLESDRPTPARGLPASRPGLS